MKYNKIHKVVAPMTQTELLALDNICPLEDTRPFGKATPSSRSFWLDNGREGDVGVELTRSSLVEGAFELSTGATLNIGLPLQSLIEGETVSVTRERIRSYDCLDSYVPPGFPVAYHPKIVKGLRRKVGRLAGGGKMFLSEDPHITIIGAGESREFVYPDAYPYTAVCKLYIDSQAQAGGPWGNGMQATGFLVGRRTLMTSGHVHPDFSGNAWRIKVIPACWIGKSIFGDGYLTYVKSAHWWHSDGGNDFMVCELYDPIGEEVGYFGADYYDSDWEDSPEWTMAGYPFDWGALSMTHQTGVSVRDDDDGDNIRLNGETYDTTQVENDADEASGASGSPLFGVFSGNFRAIGVHSGVQRDGTISGTETYSCASGGDGFVEVIRWARNQWG